MQTYISALDEDLGKAQARMDGILSADGTSTSRQHEMLKAAAKQVLATARNAYLHCAKFKYVSVKPHTSLSACALLAMSLTQAMYYKNERASVP